MHKLIASALAVMFLFSFAGAHAQVGIDVGGGANGSAGGADVEVSADADADVGTGEDEPVSSDEQDRSDASASVSLTQDDVVSASLDAESAALGSASVSTSDDLSIFATAMMKRDADIASVDASGDHVSLEYRKPARFLGFIPVSIRTTAEVSADGTVDIDYPWYRFLFAVEGSDTVKADLEARVQEIVASAGGTLNARAEAEILDAMHMTLAGSAMASAGSATTADLAGPQDDSISTETDASSEASGDASGDISPQ